VDLLISIDDTDDVDSRGTGDIAELLAQGLAAEGLAECGRVTRHQLLVHPDIAYTSHNSSMCFPAAAADDALDAVTSWCMRTLAAESVAAADPGLCVVALERLSQPERLVAYGREAKQRVIGKDEAYGVARGLGVHLSEHGGTGIGVIGALAGAGLRLSGDDGRFKGKFRVPGDAAGVARVRDIREYGVDSVRTLTGGVLGDDEPVLVGPECKLVLLAGEAVLLVAPVDGAAAAPWTVVDRRALRSY
jgi:phage tail protein X